jgi:hypothetical protein
MDETRLYGSDPEFFIYKNTINTIYGDIPNIVPPASLIADMGVKFTVSSNNKRILIDKPDYKVIEDGAALEINFKKPFNNTTQLHHTYYQAKDTIQKFLYGIDMHLKLSEDVLGFFNIKDYWEGRDENFIDCVRFGCDPDTFPKLYSMSGFEKDVCKIIDASKHEYRYAGGHIHIQNMTDNPDIYLDNLEYAPIVLDFIVGTINVLLDRGQKIKTQELARLKYYGRPGRVRLQKYSENKNGIEYRPPSNQWITDTYSTNAILQSASIAAHIIERNMAKEFYLEFKGSISKMWDALTCHNKDLSSTLLVDSIVWALNNNLVTLKDVEVIYGKF